MKRIRIQKPWIQGSRPWLEVLPLDPRDPDIVRTKALAVVHPRPPGRQPGREGRQ